MNTLNDKVAIVTGSTSGIGKETAKAFAAQGAKVIVSGRREEEGLKVVEEIRASGGEAIFVRADVTIESEVENLVAKAVESYGKVDIAFLNSGIYRISPITDQGQSELDSQLQTNVNGVYYGIKHVAKAMANKGGSIVTNSSAVGQVSFPGMTAYSLTKGAVDNLTRVAAIELAPQKIRVNAVAPGPIWTEGAEAMAGSRDNFEQAMLAAVPLGRIGESVDVANAVVFLASDDASFITGQILAVDGGIVAR